MKTIIIDNTEMYRDILREVLKESKNEIAIIAEAASAAEGLALLEKAKPDLLLLDIEMGEVSGVQMLLECKTFDFDVLFLSGSDERDYRIKALKMAGFSFCSKHAPTKELMASINRIEKQNNRQFTEERISVLRAHILRHSSHENYVIALPLHKGFSFLPIMDIIRFRMENESLHPLTIFYILSGDECWVPVHFSFYEELLSRHSFMNTDSFQMVNTKRIQRVITKYELHMDDNSLVPAKSWQPVIQNPISPQTSFFSRIIKAFRKPH
ncbi:MAG: response regulator [Chitinophagaceae bacterium]|nr:MAG: response regulator [Chitinophagaceae bacterium]